jgi:hypothetical protein
MLCPWVGPLKWAPFLCSISVKCSLHVIETILRTSEVNLEASLLEFTSWRPTHHVSWVHPSELAVSSLSGSTVLVLHKVSPDPNRQKQETGGQHFFFLV